MRQLAPSTPSRLCWLSSASILSASSLVHSWLATAPTNNELAVLILREVAREASSRRKPRIDAELVVALERVQQHQKGRPLALELHGRGQVLARTRLGVGARRFVCADVESGFELLGLILRADVDAAGADARRLRVVEAHGHGARNALPETGFELRDPHDGGKRHGLLAILVSDHELFAVL